MENNVNVEKSFLPIGTVVLLKNAKKEIMINSYCVASNGGKVYNKDGEVHDDGIVYDYGACLYPEGILNSDQMLAFNHDQIDRICFKGYETDSQRELSNVLSNSIDEIRSNYKKQTQSDAA